MIHRLTDLRLWLVLTVVLATCGLPAISQHSLDELHTRYNTYMGSVVVHVENGQATAYQYQGEVMGQLQQVPEQSRPAALAQLAASSELTPEEAEKAVVLLPVNGGRQPVFVSRDAVYRLEDASSLYPDLVAGLTIPPHLTRKKVVGVRQVPWELARTEAYKKAQAEARSEQAAVATALWLLTQDERMESSSSDVPCAVNIGTGDKQVWRPC